MCNKRRLRVITTGAYNVDMNSRKNVKTDAGEESDDRRQPHDEEEQALLALIHYRTQQVDSCRARLRLYAAEVFPFHTHKCLNSVI